MNETVVSEKEIKLSVTSTTSTIYSDSFQFVKYLDIILFITYKNSFVISINSTSFRNAATKVLPVVVLSHLEISEQLNGTRIHILSLKRPVSFCCPPPHCRISVSELLLFYAGPSHLITLLI